MSTLSDVWPFCPTDLRLPATRLLEADEAARIAAVEALAASGHPEVPDFLKDRLPGPVLRRQRPDRPRPRRPRQDRGGRGRQDPLPG